LLLGVFGVISKQEEVLILITKKSLILELNIRQENDTHPTAWIYI